jgi:SAM-dependent methyltransferase
MTATAAPQPVAEFTHRAEIQNAIRQMAAIAPAPDVHRSQTGHPLYAYDPDNLMYAALHFATAVRDGRFDDAMALLPQMRITVDVESAALNFLKLLFPAPLLDRFAPRQDSPAEDRARTCVINLYAAFLDRPRAAIEAQIATMKRDYADLWAKIVTDEDHVSGPQLGEFYNGLSVPQTDLAMDLLASRLSLACRSVPVAIAAQVKTRHGFDYGGGGGWTASAMARSGSAHVTLIEENAGLLKFAQWRDAQSGTANVSYLREHELIGSFATHAGQFDFGVCTEVLEHVLEVEATAERLAGLLKPGGLLFMTASFGLYPHPSHLKCNRRFAGKEQELMARFGFEPMNVNVPFPVPVSGGLFRRKP